MSRATDTDMDELHWLVGITLAAEVRSYRAAGLPLPPPLLAQCLKFLRHNGATVPSRAKTQG